MNTRRIWWYLGGVAAGLVGLAGLGMAWFVAAWDDAWGTSSDFAEIAGPWAVAIGGFAVAVACFRAGYTSRG